MTKAEWKRLRKLAGFKTRKAVADFLCKWPNAVAHRELMEDRAYKNWLLAEAALRNDCTKRDIRNIIKIENG